ncbi:hypothetical protein QTP86_001596 [Hemibagrus guttatus]|nr:hypothetical protein QTP86_001596 [Hemibagrus guttatus]
MKAMEDYIEEALSAGHICPSTSPVAAAFFFMEKKDGGLLTSLLRGKPKKLSWCELSREAFERLKWSFTTAPILCHSDPEIPFVVEVDASNSGIGAVLSQHQSNTNRLHPCAFYSRKLTPAEANYDVGNRTLLFIKEALEEWCHWLEGARHPFLVLTDHRNLVYLHGSKRLNPLQWALFFTRSTSSQGFTTVMVTINWFSKACKLIPLKGLPPALETATTLFHHVFKNYGLPEDIVGCELEEKERFWSELDEVMESIPTGERVVIGADFNGHVGEGNTVQFSVEKPDCMREEAVQQSGCVDPNASGLAIRDGAIPKPGSDAAAQDALNGLSVEHGQDGRQKKHCWAFLVMELVLSDQIKPVARKLTKILKQEGSAAILATRLRDLGTYSSWRDGRLQPITFSAEWMTCCSLALSLAVAAANQTVMEDVRIDSMMAV